MEDYVALESKEVRISNREKSRSKTHSSQQGFALVSLLALIPLCLSLFFAVSAALHILKKKSLAQSSCIQQAATMQEELRGTLEKLLRLNPKAKNLRAQRQAADKALKAALSSVNPYAIAAAKAYWSAVVLAQLALRSQQEALLREAGRQRQAGIRKMREQARSFRVARVQSQQYYWRALAVEAKPISSLTPDYEPVPLFSQFQQHKFKFEVDLQPRFLSQLDIKGLKQITECSVSLEGKEDRWKVRVLAASAQSKSSLF